MLQSVRPPMERAVNSYVRGVLSGKIPANKLVKQAVQRHVDDMRNRRKLGLEFRWEEAQEVVDFFGHLNLWEGEFAGQNFGASLQPFQKFILASLFGWWRKSGTRRFRTAYIALPRKNAKSTLVAGIGLYMLVMDREPGAQVFSAATKRDQAKIVFTCAKQMAQQSPLLRKFCGFFTNNIHVLATASRFEPLSRDASTMDGLSVHCALIDEVHQHPSRELIDVLETATGARRNPLVINITTAGYDRNSVCYQYHRYSEQVLSGVVRDDAFFSLIYGIDEGDDWRDEAVWAKANPNLNVSVKLDDLRAKAAKAAEMPAAQNAFRRLHLNEWTEQADRWLDMEAWDRCAEGCRPLPLVDLDGRTCYGGLDLATTTDIAALALVFPPEDEGEKWAVHCWFWIPDDSMWKRSKRDRVPYDVWERAGILTATPGNVIDYDRIRADVGDLAKRFNLRELAIDRWNATQLTTQLTGDGIDVVPFGQGFASMSAPTKELEKLVIGGQIAHGGNPVLRWMASNVAVESDAAGNLKPSKKKSTEKIDGIVALVMAIGRATVNGPEKRSIYEDQGIDWI